MSDKDYEVATYYRLRALECRKALGGSNPVVNLCRRVRAWAYDKLADSIARDLRNGRRDTQMLPHAQPGLRDV